MAPCTPKCSDITIQRSYASGVVRDVLSHRAGPRIVHDPHLFALWWEEMLPQPGVEHEHNDYSPSFFNMLKWKSTEMCTLCHQLKWCDVIWFRNNTFSTRGKVIGRSLQQLISFAVSTLATCSFQQLLGLEIRVILCCACLNSSSKVFLEKDMEVMLSKIPKDDAMAAVRWHFPWSNHAPTQGH